MKKKKIKPLIKKEMVSLNVMIPVEVKEYVWAIGAGSPTKGIRIFFETFMSELKQAAEEAKKAS